MSSELYKVLSINEAVEVSSLSTPESPSEFWVICKNDLVEYQTLKEDLQNYCRTHLSGSNLVSGVKEGDVCAVKDENNQWLRVQVEYTDGIDVYLRDVDAGALLALQLPYSLYSLPPKFHKGFLGIRCRLSGVMPRKYHLTWPSWAVRVFQDNFKPMKMKVVAIKSYIHLVDIILAGNRDMATFMCGANVADRDQQCELPKNAIETSPISYPSNKRDLQKNDVIIVTAIKTLNDFFVMRVDEDGKKEFRQLMRDLMGHCCKSEAINSIYPNMPVACMLSSLWSRASVLSVTGDCVDVFFVDFGKTMSVGMKDIRSIPEHLIRGLPVQSFHCSLDLPDFVCTDTCRDWFRSHCSDSTFIITSLKRNGDKCLIDVGTKEQLETVCEHLLQMANITSDSEPQEIVQSSFNTCSAYQEVKDGCLVKVVYAISPSDFYVQKVDKETDLIHKNLSICLNEDALAPCQNINPGMLVAAKFEDVWYRAIVNEQLQDGLVRVLFVDFGNEDIVEKQSVKMSQNSFFKSSPFLAHQCCLNGWNNASSNKFANKFKSLCLGKTFLLRNVLQKAPGLYHVDLIDPQSWELAFDIDRSVAMRQIECRKHDSDGIGAIHSHTLFPLEAGSLVSIKYSKSPLDFYISEESGDLASLTKNICNLHEHPVCNPSVGDIIASLFEGIWCRAKVLKLLPNKLLRVKFIDYGNVDDVDQKDSKGISQELRYANPKTALHCRLAFNQNDSVDGCWSEGELLRFKNNFEWKPYRLTSIKETGITDSESDMIYEVELISPEGKSMIEELKKDGSVVFRSDLGTLIEGQSYRCVLLFPGSPAEFWCQFLDPIIEFGDILPSFPTNGEYNPKLGEICLAYHEMNKEWFRAEVKKVNSKSVFVDLIDYREDLIVPFIHLRKLPIEMKRFPPLAFLCSLHGALPLSSEWSSEAKEHFSHLLGKIIDVIIVKCEDYMYWVKINTKDGISILDQLRSVKQAK